MSYAGCVTVTERSEICNMLLQGNGQKEIKSKVVSRYLKSFILKKNLLNKLYGLNSSPTPLCQCMQKFVKRKKMKGIFYARVYPKLEKGHNNKEGNNVLKIASA